MALQAPGHNAGARGCDLESALRSGDQGEKEGGAIGAVSRLAGGNGVPVLPAAVEEDPSCPSVGSSPPEQSRHSQPTRSRRAIAVHAPFSAPSARRRLVATIRSSRPQLSALHVPDPDPVLLGHVEPPENPPSRPDLF